MVMCQRGHDAIELRTVLPTDTPDEVVWARAETEGRIMLSCNRAHFMAAETPHVVDGGLAGETAAP